MEYKVGTIRQIHHQLVCNGYQVSEHALRLWIKQGSLPAVFSGTKALISYERVKDILDGGHSGMAG